MTIGTNIFKNQYTGNGSNTVFTYGFKIFNENDIDVLLDDTLQTITTDYTVSGVGSDTGGNVTFLVPPASGVTVTLTRDEPLTQEIDYVENDDFPSAAHEEGLDRSTIRDQFLQEQINRCILLSAGTTLSGLTFPALEANKYLQVNTTADGFIFNAATVDVVSALNDAVLPDIGTPDSNDIVLIKDVSDNGNVKTVDFSEFMVGGTSNSVIQEVNQTSHGFIVGDVLRLNATTYVKAQADNSVNSEVVGIVSSVVDVDNFTLLTSGSITGLSSLTAGAVYFLDPVTAGAITSTEPNTTGQISKPVLIADTATSGQFYNFRGASVDILTPPGKILQVQSVTKTDTASTNSTTFAELMSASITPVSTASKVYVIATLSISATGGTEAVSLRLQRDTTDIALGDVAGSRKRVTTGGQSVNAAVMGSFVMSNVDSPATTSPVTYSVEWARSGFSAITIYANRSVDDVDNSLYDRAVSTLTLMEIGA